ERAHTEVHDPDANVTAKNPTKYFRKRLPPLARQHGRTKEEKDQYAAILGYRYTHFDLSRNPAAAAGIERRLQRLQALVAEKTVTDAVAREGARVLAAVPTGKSPRP